MCVVVLDGETGRPQQINPAFESIFGPLYKFKNWDFANAAVTDDVGGKNKTPNDEDETADTVSETLTNPSSGSVDEKDSGGGGGNKKVNDNRRKFRDALRRVGGGDSFSARVMNVEMLVLGEGLPVRKFFDWSVGSHCPPQQDFHGGRGGGSSGGARQVILYGTPVTPAEAKDRERDAELVDFFQNAPIALHWLNGEGIVLWANNTELNVLGYTAEEYIGQPIMKFCPDEQELVLEIFKQLGSGNTIKDVPVRFRTKDGKLVNLLIDSNVAYNKDGSFGHTRCFIRDDTGRKIRDARAALLLEESERSQRMMDGFLCRALHHVKTPLQALQGACDLMTDFLRREQNNLPRFIGSDGSVGNDSSLSFDETEGSISLLEAASRGINGTVQMATDASDLARLDQGAVLKTSIRKISLRDMGVKVLKDAVDPEICDRITVSVELVGGGPDSMHTDRKVLHRTLCHLLANAVRETVAKFDKIPERGGKVTLRIKSQGSGVDNRGHSVKFEVEDNGPGLPISEGAAAETGEDASGSGRDYAFQKYTGLLKEDFKVSKGVANEGGGSKRSSKAKDDKALQAARVEIEEQIKSRNTNGMGIGLPLSYYLAASLGSDLRFSSKPGVGAKFWLAVPDNNRGSSAAESGVLKSETIHLGSILGEGSTGSASDDDFSIAFSSDSANQFLEEDAQDSNLAVPAARIAECGVRAMVQPSILLVEDTSVSAKMITMQLRKIGCAICWAKDGKEAVDILRESEPGLFDLVLMDLRMPVMDGFEATKCIRNELGLADIPIVALTGEAEGHSSKECLANGFNDFYSKPIKRNELREIVGKFVMKDGKKDEDEVKEDGKKDDDKVKDTPDDVSSSPEKSVEGSGSPPGGDEGSKKRSDSKVMKRTASPDEPSSHLVNAKDDVSTIKTEKSTSSNKVSPSAVPSLEDPARLARNVDSSSPKKTKEKACVLVVEDTAMCAKVAMMMIKKMGCDVRWAKDGKEAVDMVKESPPATFDMILMDLRMPVMDGFEATKIIRGDLGISDVPIVALTGEAQDQTEQECKELGFNDFHTKPMRRGTMKKLISQYIMS